MINFLMNVWKKMFRKRKTSIKEVEIRYIPDIESVTKFRKIVTEFSNVLVTPAGVPNKVAYYRLGTEFSKILNDECREEFIKALQTPREA